MRNNSVFVLPHVIRKTALDTNLSKDNENNVHTTSDVKNNLVSQGFCFKAPGPENVVDHMHNVPVQDVHDSSSS
jgi:hypothetical protein